MKSRLLLIIAIAFTFYSCSTKQYITASFKSAVDKKLEFIIVRNDLSLIIPVGVYPDQKFIEKYVVRSQPAIARIDSLIYNELTKRGFTARIVNPGVLHLPGSNYIKYQDYWAWDFKKYMHVLKIYFYGPENEKKVLEAVSQGNKMGLHDYPNPKKQVPVLMEKALSY
ncbi:hypothetical protein [Dyadobacter bucti]|uniref:hypothetical protein n=1 Tax=Dyadobacter bucti TaxID=2572203 RepID=UPI003F6E9D83